jgi:Alginate lyase
VWFIKKTAAFIILPHIQQLLLFFNFKTKQMKRKRLLIAYGFTCSIFLLHACTKQQVTTTETETATQQKSATVAAAAAVPTLPSQVLNLTNWKITLPIDANGNTSGTATEVKQPDLDDFSISPYFRVTSTGTGVSFKAHCGGATTSGSGYPRSELREMKNNGSANASWSSGSGTHTMEIEQSIKQLPVKKPEVIAGQIHDGTSDVIAFRLEGDNLIIDAGGTTKATLTGSYVLGTKFTVKFVVSGNQTKCYYNGSLRYTLNKSFGTAYFKAGVYTQSSCKGVKKVPGESCDALGEVIIYKLTVTHS